MCKTRDHLRRWPVMQKLPITYISLSFGNLLNRKKFLQYHIWTNNPLHSALNFRNNTSSPVVLHPLWLTFCEESSASFLCIICVTFTFLAGFLFLFYQTMQLVSHPNHTIDWIFIMILKLKYPKLNNFHPRQDKIM